MNSKPFSDTHEKHPSGLMGLFTLTTGEGRLKSTFLLYAFSLSLLCIVLYAAASFLLTPPLDAALKKHFPIVIVNFAEAAVPAAAGTLVILGLGMLLKDKRLLPAAFGLLFLFAFALLLTIVLSSSGDERVDMLTLFAMFIPAPFLTGGAAVLAQYVRHKGGRNP